MTQPTSNLRTQDAIAGMSDVEIDAALKALGPLGAWAAEYIGQKERAARVAHDQAMANGSEAQRLRAAFSEARDAILNGRGPLEATLDGDQTNAVLAVIDDAFSLESPAETGPDAIPDYVQFGWVPYHEKQGCDPDSFVEHEENCTTIIKGWRWVPAYAEVNSSGKNGGVNAGADYNPDGTIKTVPVRCEQHGTFQIAITDRIVGNCSICDQPMRRVGTSPLTVKDGKIVRGSAKKEGAE